MDAIRGRLHRVWVMPIRQIDESRACGLPVEQQQIETAVVMRVRQELLGMRKR